MELQWIMPVPPFDAGKKARSCLVLVDRLTLPKVAVRGILWSLSICAVDRHCAVSGYRIDGWMYWLLAVPRWDGRRGLLLIAVLKTLHFCSRMSYCAAGFRLGTI